MPAGYQDPSTIPAVDYANRGVQAGSSCVVAALAERSATSSMDAPADSPSPASIAKPAFTLSAERTDLALVNGSRAAYSQAVDSEKLTLPQSPLASDSLHTLPAHSISRRTLKLPVRSLSKAASGTHAPSQRVVSLPEQRQLETRPFLLDEIGESGLAPAPTSSILDPKGDALALGSGLRAVSMPQRLQPFEHLLKSPSTSELGTHRSFDADVSICSDFTDISGSIETGGRQRVYALRRDAGLGEERLRTPSPPSSPESVEIISSRSAQKLGESFLKRKSASQPDAQGKDEG